MLSVWWRRSIVSRLSGREEDGFFEYLWFGLERWLGRLGWQFGFVAVGQMRHRGHRFAILLQRALVLLGKTLGGCAHVWAVGFLGRDRRGAPFLWSRRATTTPTGSPGRKVHDQVRSAAGHLIHVGGAVVLLELVSDSGKRLPVDRPLRVSPLPPQLDLVVERVVAHTQALGVSLGPRTVVVTATTAVRRL